jgi:hypothetical protein
LYAFGADNSTSGAEKGAESGADLLVTKSRKYSENRM